MAAMDTEQRGAQRRTTLKGGKIVFMKRVDFPVQ